MMSITRTMTMTVLVTLVSFSAIADSGHHPEETGTKTSSQMPMANGQMQMMGSQQGGMPMMKGQGNMPMMGGDMKDMPMMEMMQGHMNKMETHLATIEILLQQLVELQKK